MGSFNSASRSIRAFARVSFYGVLCASVVIAQTGSAFAMDADAAMKGASGLAKMAQGLSAPLSAATAAQGGNSMLKGKQQMECCKEGCDGAGKEAAGNKAAQDAAGQAGGKAIDGVKVPESSGPSPKPFNPPPSQKLPDVYGRDQAMNWLPVPASEGFTCSVSASKAKMLFDLFRPHKVEAAAGCNDAMQAMAQGAMQMLQGLMGMMAAMNAGKQSSKGAGNASNLGAMPGSAAEVPATVSGASLASDGSSGKITIDPASLRDGKAASVFADFEKNFGIPREVFASSMANGVDPREMLMNAPKNAFTASEMNMAFAAAKNMSEAEKNAAMAQFADAQKDAAGKIEAAAMNAGGKSPNRSTSSSSSGELDDLGLGEGAKADAASNLADSGLSPEVQAALAQREAASLRETSTIFQVIHRKYQEKIRMIYGFDAHGKSLGGGKGVADANGF